MPLSLSTTAIQEKNKLAGGAIFVLCLEIQIPDVLAVDYPRILNDNVELVWNGYTWQPFDFQIDEITDSNTGVVQQVTLRVSNISRVMRQYIEAYDLYCKNNGYEPIILNLYYVNRKRAAESPMAAAEVSYEFELLAPHSDPLWAAFTIGSENPWNNRFPSGRMLKNTCRYRYFKTDTRCAYAGATATCDRTLVTCRSIESGTSTAVGLLSLTDGAKTWPIPLGRNLVLIDSAGKKYKIVSNTATVLTLAAGSGTPTAGAYTISNSSNFGGAPGIGGGGFTFV